MVKKTLPPICPMCLPPCCHLNESDVVDVSSDGVFELPAEEAEVLLQQRQGKKLKDAAKLRLSQTPSVGVAAIEVLRERG